MTANEKEDVPPKNEAEVNLMVQKGLEAETKASEELEEQYLGGSSGGGAYDEIFKLIDAFAQTYPYFPESEKASLTHRLVHEILEKVREK